MIVALSDGGTGSWDDSRNIGKGRGGGGGADDGGKRKTRMERM